MRHRHVLKNFPILILFVVLAPAALASTTWYVDGVNGSDNNDCKTSQTACKTIGHAISLASSGDTIMVAPATYAENLTINFSLKIIGSDATTTIVDGNQAGTVITIASPTAVVTLSKLTIRNGNSYDGGGIYNPGTLTVNQSTVTGNEGYEGGAIYNANHATLTVTNSTITANSAATGSGIENQQFGALTITNSTISGNNATGAGGGGGIISHALGTVTITNSTISGNIAIRGGGILSQTIYFPVLQNTILANNSGRNCVGTVTSNGYNLSSDKSCKFNGPGDMNNTHPKLGTLGYHGGPTQTIPLRVGSPAVDAGNPNGCTDSHGNLLKTDQRGKPRPDPEDASGCDIGAYERQKN